jgi:methyl coenzyme M reductase subunit C-like uncharacterized protein (methanogenesis marker protein 7)
LTELTHVTIETIGGGVIPELFDREIAAILENIADPNTTTKKAREIDIKIKITPQEGREVAFVEVSCNSKLAGVDPKGSAIYIARQQGALVALVKDPRQETLKFDGPEVISGGQPNA